MRLYLFLMLSGGRAYRFSSPIEKEGPLLCLWSRDVHSQRYMECGARQDLMAKWERLECSHSVCARGGGG